MIENILKKAARGERPDDSEALELLSATKSAEIDQIMAAAFEVKTGQSRIVKLTSTVHITNQCRITPKCTYCGFAAGTSPDGYYHPFYKTDQEILRAIEKIAGSGIPRVSCSGAYGYGGEQAVTAARLVKGHSSLELLVNVGPDLTGEALNELSRYGTDTICCNLETVNPALFASVKPGETLAGRIGICEKIAAHGIELSSGLLIGLGESPKDRLMHLRFLERFETLGEIPVMGFNPYRGTPMAHHPPCPVSEQLKTIAVVRLLYPEIRITVPTPTIGPKNVRSSLLAGADNLATVIPAGYPLDIKGVGSPVCGSLGDVLEVIGELGLKPQMNTPASPVEKSVPVIN